MFGAMHGVRVRSDRVDHLLRGQEGARRRFQIDRLSDELGRRPIAVAHSQRGWLPERLTIWLDGGARVRLKLFWQPAATPAALVAISWRDGVGWVLHLRTTRGDPQVLYAWQVVVDYPPGSSEPFTGR